MDYFSNRSKRLFACMLAVALNFFCSGEWTAVYVIDGDTFRARRGAVREKVRLKGVDAPEVPHPEYGRKGDPFGWESRECLMGLIEGRVVRLGFDASSQIQERDQYGRLLAYVYVDEKLINKLLIRRGCARAFRKYPHSRMEEFIRADDFPVLKRGKHGERVVNARALVKSMSLNGPDGLDLVMNHGPGPGLKPAEIIKEVFQLSGSDLDGVKVLKVKQVLC